MDSHADLARSWSARIVLVNERETIEAAGLANDDGFHIFPSNCLAYLEVIASVVR
jgi:hypothetical protein